MQQPYPIIVRTGSQELDVQTVEQHRRAAAAQGVTLFVQPLPGGGFQLTPSTPAQEAIGSTLPSNQPPLSPQRASQTPAASPKLQQQAADPSGTLPSHFAAYAQAAPARAPQVEVILRPGEGYCEACHRVGALRQATFTQNIGAIVLRFPRTVSGQLCKLCIDKYFFRFTAVTMLLGWWGVISFFHSLYVVPANTIRWIGSFGLEPPPDDVDSLRDRRARGSAGIAMGLLISLFSLSSLGLGALLATTEDDRGVVPLAVIGATFGVLAVVVLFFAIRTRARASGGLRRLGAR